MRRGVIAIVALMALSLVANFFSRSAGDDSPLPSITNQGPRGAAVVATWLREAGVTVTALDAPLTSLPEHARVVVLAAPMAEELREPEVVALEAFVRSGGTLVYLAPREGAQPALNRWLTVRHAAAPPIDLPAAGLDDVGGATAKVTFAAGLLSGAKALRVSAEKMVELSAADAVAVVEHGALWYRPLGTGEVWVGSGADLLENARLELADNALFWNRLAARAAGGAVVFDEFHHHRGATVMPVNLVVSGLQLVFVALVFVWARGARLGPVRDAPPTQHRAALEYVHAMAALTRNAKVEDELVVALKADFRARLQEERGLPTTLSWDEVATELARRGEATREAVLDAAGEARFVQLSRALARLER